MVAFEVGSTRDEITPEYANLAALEQEREAALQARTGDEITPEYANLAALEQERGAALKARTEPSGECGGGSVARGNPQSSVITPGS